MVVYGWEIMMSVWEYSMPTLHGLSQGIQYIPVVVAGVLICMFSTEHVIATVQHSGGGAVMALMILSGSFGFLLVLGVPVAFAIGLACVAAISFEGIPVAVVFQRMVSGMNIFSFLAIPFFIFSGELMLHGGIAQKIVDLAKSAVGHVRGGLGMANVIACTLFGGVSGSPVADVSAMGGVMIPMMKKEGYDADYAVNVTTHASLVGALMPTSHNMIIYAFATGGKVSITSLMLAGIVPALFLTVCMLVAAYFVAVRRGYPASSWHGWHTILVTFIAALPGLLVVVIILGGITTGIFTPTESAAIAVCWSLLLTFVIYRTMTWEKLMVAAAKAVKTTGIILLLIGLSATLQHLMSLYELADLTGEALSGLTTNPLIIFLMINIILFLLGTFMDMASTILICTPIFLPIAMEMGMGPVQFGMVILINCALGLNTPPVGTTQFVGCAIGGSRSVR